MKDGAWVWEDPNTGDTGYRLYSKDGTTVIFYFDDRNIDDHKFADGTEDWKKFNEFQFYVLDSIQEVYIDWSTFTHLASQFGIDAEEFKNEVL